MLLTKTEVFLGLENRTKIAGPSQENRATSNWLCAGFVHSP